MDQKICIVGSGLVGSMLAAYMAKKGLTIDVYERRPDLRKTDISAGKSINLACSDRGWRALAGIGAEQAIRDMAIPMHGRLIHDIEGNKEMMPYAKVGQYISSVSRGGINMHLMSLAEQSTNTTFFFNHRCVDVNLDTGHISFKNEDDGSVIEKQYDRIFGTDGAFSAIRAAMQKRDRFDYSQFYIPSSYKELTMPPVASTTWAIEKNALHIWPRKSFMLIALPNLDGSFTCTLFMPINTGEETFANLTNDKLVMQFFNKYFGDAVPHMGTLIEDWHENATSSLVTVRCKPWNYKDKVLLMGDAAHAIVPFYGQGMISGFEDVRVFNDMMEKHSDWGDLFHAFSENRKPNGDAISELALRNYTEMADLVADPDFVLKRKISGRLQDLLENKWIPLYSMVTFSHIPYAEAIAKGDTQKAILNKIVAENNISESSSDAELLEAVKPLLG